MKVYLISQDINDGYDTYDSAVVIAENEDAARKISPSPFRVYSEELQGFAFEYSDGRLERDEFSSWVDDPDQVEVEYLGEAKEGSKPGTVCASFNAG